LNKWKIGALRLSSEHSENLLVIVESQKASFQTTQTFKAGAQELQTMKTKLLETNTSHQFLANHSIIWKFITERAPWWGGFYERLIGLLK